jgi:glutathione S-transferase
MLRYYYSAPACSLTGMVAIEATGVSYEPVAVNLGGDRAELRQVSTSGKVPALDAGGLVITDTIAIVYWLAKRFPAAGLLPDADSEMALALSTMAWFGTELHIVRRRYSRPSMFCTHVGAQEEIRKTAVAAYWEGLKRVDECIAAGLCFGGSQQLGVEAYALLFYHWALVDGLPVDTLPHFKALSDRLVAHPGVARSLKRHESPLLLPKVA